MGIPEGLIRYSFGIEDPDELIADLKCGIAGRGMTGPGIAEPQLGILDSGHLIPIQSASGRCSGQAVPGAVRATKQKSNGHHLPRTLRRVLIRVEVWNGF